jgi:uncharacterized protein YqeY
MEQEAVLKRKLNDDLAQAMKSGDKLKRSVMLKLAAG